MSEFREAVQDFTGPTEMAPREGGRLPGPSLWDQVLSGVSRQGGGSGGKPNSRPPVTTGALSLVAEVERMCRAELAVNGDSVSHTRAGDRDIPDELERIAGHVESYPDHGDWWATKVLEWCATARNLLGLVPQRIGLPRGTRCIRCDEAWIERVTDEGELVHEPALVLLWSEDKSAIERFHCLACLHDAPASDLLDLAHYQRRAA